MKSLSPACPTPTMKTIDARYVTQRQGDSTTQGAISKGAPDADADWCPARVPKNRRGLVLEEGLQHHLNAESLFG